MAVLKLKSIHLSEERDIPLLLFLWKWKFATTAVIWKRFFPNAVPHTAYRRLLSLKQNSLIEFHNHLKGRHTVWALTGYGMSVIKSFLPEVASENKRSEHLLHDIYVNAFHLGEWLVGTPDGVELYSEQQLRAVAEHRVPEWIPNPKIKYEGQYYHRSDGYWRIPKDERFVTIALEVEISRQRSVRYEQIIEFYYDQKNVVRVLWLVKTESFALYLEEKIKAKFGGGNRHHNFIILSDFLKKGWDSPIFLGPEKDKTLARILGAAPHGGPHDRVWYYLLDARKQPYNSTTCKIPNFSSGVLCR